MARGPADNRAMSPVDTPALLAVLQLAKGVLVAWVLPPGPGLALALAGAWLARSRPRAGRALAAIGCVLVWLGACEGIGAWLEAGLLVEPHALDAGGREALAAEVRRGERVAIVVLGGGLSETALEYGRPAPDPLALERLRYGVWLARATGAPLAISGGTGWSSPPRGIGTAAPMPEADVLGDIGAEELGFPPRWRERASRDTRENARDTVGLLAPEGIRTLVVVTHGWHMPRALREFRAAAAGVVTKPRIVPAPMGQAEPATAGVLRWCPSSSGFERVRAVLREALAAWAAPG